MNVWILIVGVCLFLFVDAVHAIKGSDTFVCELLEYSTDMDERYAASEEAKKRGICGFPKPVAVQPAESTSKSRTDAERQKAGDKLFIGTALVCIAKGKCEQPHR